MPRASSRWAMRTLSSIEKDTPSPWVPSLNVVSYTLISRGMRRSSSLWRGPGVKFGTHSRLEPARLRGLTERMPGLDYAAWGLKRNTFSPNPDRSACFHRGHLGEDDRKAESATDKEPDP